jgi:hypothetical protein
MGAYENPQQIIDTQSGNAWAAATDEISSNFTKAAKEVSEYVEENKKKNEAIIEYGEAEASKLRQSVYNAQASAPEGSSIDLISAFEPKINRLKELRIGLKKKSSASPVEDQREIDEILSSVPKVKGMLEDWAADSDDFIKAQGLQGEGAIDFATSDPTAVAIVSILSNRIPGSVSPTFIGGDNKRVGMAYKYKDPKTGKDVNGEIDYNDYQKMVNNSGGGIVKIPGLSKTFSDVKKNSINVYAKDENGANTGEISEAFVSKKLVRQEKKATASGVYVQNVYEVDKTSMMNNASLMTPVIAKAEAMFETSGSDALSIYNSKMLPLIKNKDAVPAALQLEELSRDFVIDRKKPATDDQKNDPNSDYSKFKRNMQKLFLLTEVPNEQAISNPDFIKRASPSGSSGNSGKLTAQQKADAAKKTKVANKLKAIEKTVEDGVRTNANLPKGFTYNKTTKKFSFISDSGKGSSYTAEELKAAVKNGEF